MRVGILFGGASVGGPAGVAYAERAFQRMLAQDFFQVHQLAFGATHIERGARWAAYGDAG